MSYEQIISSLDSLIGTNQAKEKDLKRRIEKLKAVISTVEGGFDSTQSKIKKRITDASDYYYDGLKNYGNSASNKGKLSDKTLKESFLDDTISYLKKERHRCERELEDVQSDIATAKNKRKVVKQQQQQEKTSSGGNGR